VCGGVFPISYFQCHTGMKDGRKNECRECCRKYNRAREIKNGHISHDKNPSCSWYLGVALAEPILKRIFESATRMPPNTHAFDFVCGKGYHIDVKASRLLYSEGKYPHWLFTIKRNYIPDFFLCVGYDSKLESPTLMHVWLIPSTIVSHLYGLAISESTITKWSIYEKDISVIR